MDLRLLIEQEYLEIVTDGYCTRIAPSAAPAVDMPDKWSVVALAQKGR